MINTILDQFVHRYVTYARHATGARASARHIRATCVVGPHLSSLMVTNPSVRAVAQAMGLEYKNRSILLAQLQTGWVSRRETVALQCSGIECSVPIIGIITGLDKDIAVTQWEGPGAYGLSERATGARLGVSVQQSARVKNLYSAYWLAFLCRDLSLAGIDFSTSTPTCCGNEIRDFLNRKDSVYDSLQAYISAHCTRL